MMKNISCIKKGEKRKGEREGEKTTLNEFKVFFMQQEAPRFEP